MTGLRDASFLIFINFKPHAYAHTGRKKASYNLESILGTARASVKDRSPRLAENNHAHPIAPASDFNDERQQR